MSSEVECDIDIRDYCPVVTDVSKWNYLNVVQCTSMTSVNINVIWHNRQHTTTHYDIVFEMKIRQNAFTKHFWCIFSDNPLTSCCCVTWYHDRIAAYCTNSWQYSLSVLAAIFLVKLVSHCLLKQRMMEAVVTTGAINRAKLQSNHHHQQPNTQFSSDKHWKHKI